MGGGAKKMVEQLPLPKINLGVRGQKFGFVAIYSPVNVRISRAGNVPNQEFIAYLDAAF